MPKNLEATDMSLKERMQQLERQLADLQSKLGEAVPRQRTSLRPNSEKVGESYWKTRSERLARVQVLKPLDSTLAVSEDRDRA